MPCSRRELTPRSGAGALTTCDLLPLIDRFAQQPFHVRRIADELRRIASDALNGSVSAHASDETLRHALFTGYADRLGKRRSSARDRVTLASGHGAALARESGVRDGDYLVALDVVSATREGIDEARIYAASRVEREWIVPSSTQVEHRIDDSNRVRAARVARFDAIVLSETPVAVEPATAAVLLRDAWLAREPDGPDAAILRRLRFAGIEVDLPAIVLQAAVTARALDEIDLEAHLPFEVRRSLAALAPPSIVVPSGRSTTLEYGEDGSVSASVKLQELFGLAETPTVGPRQVPILFHLLAPNGRTGADDARSAELLGDDISRGAQGAAGPLSEASLAGGPVDGAGDPSDNEETLNLSPVIAVLFPVSIYKRVHKAKDMTLISEPHATADLESELVAEERFVLHGAVGVDRGSWILAPHDRRHRRARTCGRSSGTRRHRRCRARTPYGRRPADTPAAVERWQYRGTAPTLPRTGRSPVVVLRTA